MANADQRERRRHCSAGYAAAGYTAGQGLGGDIPERHCSASAVLCGRKRAKQYPPASGGGYCGGKGKGREVRKTAPTAAGELSRSLSALEIREMHLHSGGSGMWVAAVYIPGQGEGLRKHRYSAKGLILRICVPFRKETFTL